MLKNLMLLGWFRWQPFHKYIIFAMLIAPLLAASAHTTSAKQSQAVKLKSVTPTSDTFSSESVSNETASLHNLDLAEVSKIAENDTFAAKSYSLPLSLAVVPQAHLLPDDMESSSLKDDSLIKEIPESETDLLAAVELAPPVPKSESLKEDLTESQENLIARLKASKIESLARVDDSVSEGRMVPAATLQAATVIPPTGILRNSTAVPVTEEPPKGALEQQDPVGSPHPIPWTWIQTTQEAITSRGGSGVRYYRSVPVVSPDGRYAIYSRVQIEVQPKMYNSHVNSVLFVEDRQTKQLRVVSSTSTIRDPLLKASLSSPRRESQGTIAVLVPVSWSEKGDRFLARRFEGAMNTSDVTDYAVIWNRQNRESRTVTPSQQKHKHEIAVLLGWSKQQPNHVLFRAGELGEEEWPQVTVAYDGTTVAATAVDRPVTFGDKVQNIWADPQVAYR
jgi:flagella basal body P-ring formation protein FlgA